MHTAATVWQSFSDPWAIMDRPHVTAPSHLSRVLGYLALAGSARDLINSAPNYLTSHTFQPIPNISFSFFFPFPSYYIDLLLTALVQRYITVLLMPITWISMFHRRRFKSFPRFDWFNATWIHYLGRFYNCWWINNHFVFKIQGNHCIELNNELIRLNLNQIRLNKRWGLNDAHLIIKEPLIPFE